jgi:N-acetyl-1-D-myo-inositol-2-amino-2-deoxy-alpha-D-glucopyranoside deacetylase
VLAAVEAAAIPTVEPEAGPAWAVPSLWLATLAESDLRPAPVDVRPWLDVKWAALRAHASEFARGGRVTAFEDARLREQVLGTEWYLYRPGPGAAPQAGPEDPLAP